MCDKSKMLHSTAMGWGNSIWYCMSYGQQPAVIQVFCKNYGVVEELLIANKLIQFSFVFLRSLGNNIFFN